MAHWKHLEREKVADYYLLNVDGGDGQDEVQSRGINLTRQNCFELARGRQRDRVKEFPISAK